MYGNTGILPYKLRQLALRLELLAKKAMEAGQEVL